MSALLPHLSLFQVIVGIVLLAVIGVILLATFGGRVHGAEPAAPSEPEELDWFSDWPEKGWAVSDGPLLCGECGWRLATSDGVCLDCPPPEATRPDDLLMIRRRPRLHHVRAFLKYLRHEFDQGGRGVR